jgi:hypothetical protein
MPVSLQFDEFDFLHCEMLHAREEIVNGSVIRVRAVTLVYVNFSITISVCVAVIKNINFTAVTKFHTPYKMVINRVLLLFRSQSEFPRQDAMRIPQYKDKNLQAIVILALSLV